MGQPVPSLMNVSLAFTSGDDESRMKDCTVTPSNYAGVKAPGRYSSYITVNGTTVWTAQGQAIHIPFRTELFSDNTYETPAICFLFNCPNKSLGTSFSDPDAGDRYSPKPFHYLVNVDNDNTLCVFYNKQKNQPGKPLQLMALTYNDSKVIDIDPIPFA
eukprot:CAMPEP_0203770042 /NCGR_PEP_ID=MMETSP0099_2-20121227/2557_1 /ASSEMBLY_ACC=CAM_ASM_000209 /TAXON_ID=96639 /ORGANISM=" , Strain NY0313808BC1" /LENGTH=158 /DNA_ID=CAMNT_0050667067 /DNA_START=609 /DNA_END=1085 /DNA_ORIENTATION=+